MTCDLGRGRRRPPGNAILARFRNEVPEAPAAAEPATRPRPRVRSAQFGRPAVADGRERQAEAGAGGGTGTPPRTCVPAHTMPARRAPPSRPGRSWLAGPPPPGAPRRWRLRSAEQSRDQPDEEHHQEDDDDPDPQADAKDPLDQVAA